MPWPEPPRGMEPPDRELTLDEVKSLGAPAWRQIEGSFAYAFDDGVFWYCSPDRAEQRIVKDEDELPPDGWSHNPACNCTVCALPEA